MTRAYIDDQLKGKQNWVPTTVLNFLARLTERGFVHSVQSSKEGYCVDARNGHDHLLQKIK